MRHQTYTGECKAKHGSVLLMEPDRAGGDSRGIDLVFNSL